MFAVLRSPTEIAQFSVPLALALVLAETTVGCYLSVLFLRQRGGLTRGFEKFMAGTLIALGGLTALTTLGAHPDHYQRLLTIQPAAATVLPGLLMLLLPGLIANAILVWRQRQGEPTTYVLGVGASALILGDIAILLAPLSGSAGGAAILSLAVLLSSAVLGAATTGMLLGHWYLVTPALTNRPLLRAIAVLLGALILQTAGLPIALGTLRISAGSMSVALGRSSTLTGLWALTAVLLPLLACGLALPACRLRSFMSTTGLLYLAMITILPGQILGLLLMFVAAG